MTKPSAVTRKILKANAGRDGERLTLKFAAIRQDAFAFFRGTNALFLDFMPRAHALYRAPATLVSGDLHMENFGAFKGDNRLCYFDVNDFDEACLAPFTVDVVRFLSSIQVAAPGLRLGKAQTRDLIARFLDTYCASVRDGKPRWMERSLAKGVFRVLLRRASSRTRLALLDRYTKLKGGRRRLRVDGRRAFALSAGEAPRLDKLLAGMSAHGQKRRFFELLDAAHRIAGNGSLGLPRFSLLVRGRGSPDGNFVLDLKQAAPSAVALWLKRKQPAWPDEATRVVTVQHITQAIAPAMLHPTKFRGRPFVLKELQPMIDRLDLTQWRGKRRRFVEAVEGMARVAAWSHLRGCGHHGAASVETLQAYVADARWTKSARRLADLGARRSVAAWKIYRKDYDAGLVSGAAQVSSAGPLT